MLENINLLNYWNSWETVTTFLQEESNQGVIFGTGVITATAVAALFASRYVSFQNPLKSKLIKRIYSGALFALFISSGCSQYNPAGTELGNHSLTQQNDSSTYFEEPTRAEKREMAELLAYIEKDIENLQDSFADMLSSIGEKVKKHRKVMSQEVSNINPEYLGDDLKRKLSNFDKSLNIFVKETSQLILEPKLSNLDKAIPLNNEKAVKIDIPESFKKASFKKSNRSEKAEFVPQNKDLKNSNELIVVTHRLQSSDSDYLRNVIKNDLSHVYFPYFQILQKYEEPHIEDGVRIGQQCEDRASDSDEEQGTSQIFCRKCYQNDNEVYLIEYSIRYCTSSESEREEAIKKANNFFDQNLVLEEN